jgi:rubrerythrin
MEEIASRLSLLPSLSKSHRIELLFTLAVNSKEFIELLALTHMSSTRKAINHARSHDNSVKLGLPSGKLLTRLEHLLQHSKQILLSSAEYMIVFTLASDEYITQSMREQLKHHLSYTPVLVKPEKVLVSKCKICGYPCNGILCLSCGRKNIEFTKFRREHFVVPVNYLNYNIRNDIDLESYFNYRYKDWDITKYKSTVSFKLVSDLYNSDREDYQLPFPDYQIAIV